MNGRANYFKIGVFVLVGTALFVAGLILFGAGALKDKGVVMETYLDESVQGLDVGSPVKYRGVQIGNVREIGFVGAYYPDADRRFHRYVLVRGNLRAENLSDKGAEDLKQILQDEIAGGMRVRLSSQGLTGLMYLEVDYMDPELAEPLEINWKPEVPYLPSAPGRITLIADSLEKVAVGLERSNIEGIANNINELIVTIRGTVEELQLNDLTNRATELVNEVRQTNQEINDLLTSQEVKQMASDAASTVAAARGMVDGSENDIRNTVGQLRQTVERLNEVTAKAKDLLNSPEIQTGLQNFASTSENARNASENLPETLESVQRSLKRVDLMLGSRQQDLQAIIQNLRQVSENLREITDDARKYPSYTLFGNPPEPRETEK